MATTNNLEVLCIADLERMAHKKMDKMAREYYNSGCDSEETLRDNVYSFSKYKLRPRVLRDVSNVSISTTLWSQNLSFPLCIAPTGIQKLAHPDGEVATSRAAAKMGVAMGLSSYSNSAMEDVISAGEGKVGYALQLYVFENRKTTETLVRRAEGAGFKALLLTVDTPILGKRINERRNRFQLPPHVQLLNFEEPGKMKTYQDLTREREERVKKGLDPKEVTTGGNIIDPSLNWGDDIKWLRSITNMEIWLKGILTAEDTLLAISHKVDGIIISNHGGRQLDTVLSTLDALPECVAAAAGRIPIHIDGGIRKGTDIFKAIALGADCCWIGRVPLWGLSYDGQAGVELALNILQEEFRMCMQLAGCRSVKEIGKHHLARVLTSGEVARL
ncbi:hypothetical protein RUND412_005917 [Rhizina undulata]